MMFADRLSDIQIGILRTKTLDPARPVRSADQFPRAGGVISQLSEDDPAHLFAIPVGHGLRSPTRFHARHFELLVDENLERRVKEGALIASYSRPLLAVELLRQNIEL